MASRSYVPSVAVALFCVQVTVANAGGASGVHSESIPPDAAVAARNILSHYWIKCGDSYFVPERESTERYDWRERLYLIEYRDVSRIQVVGNNTKYVNGVASSTFLPGQADRMNGMAWMARLAPQVKVSRSMTFHLHDGGENLYGDIEKPWGNWEDHPFGGSILFEFYKKNGVIFENFSHKPLNDYIDQLPPLPKCSEIPR